LKAGTLQDTVLRRCGTVVLHDRKDGGGCGSAIVGCHVQVVECISKQAIYFDQIIKNGRQHGRYEDVQALWPIREDLH